MKHKLGFVLAIVLLAHAAPPSVIAQCQGESLATVPQRDTAPQVLSVESEGTPFEVLAAGYIASLALIVTVALWLKRRVAAVVPHLRSRLRRVCDRYARARHLMPVAAAARAV